VLWNGKGCLLSCLEVEPCGRMCCVCFEWDRLCLVFVEVKVQGGIVVFIWFRRLEWDDRKMELLKFWTSS